MSGLFAPRAPIVVQGAFSASALTANQVLLSYVADTPVRILDVSVAATTAGVGTGDHTFDIKVSAQGAAFASILSVPSSSYNNLSGGTLTTNVMPTIKNASKVLAPGQVTFAALDTTQKAVVSAGRPTAEMTNWVWTGFGSTYDYSSGYGGVRATLYKSGAPAVTDGNPGDWYYDYTNARLYGPKTAAGFNNAASAWPTGFTALTSVNAVLAATGVTAVTINAGDAVQLTVNGIPSTSGATNVSSAMRLELI